MFNDTSNLIVIIYEKSLKFWLKLSIINSKCKDYTLSFRLNLESAVKTLRTEPVARNRRHLELAEKLLERKWWTKLTSTDSWTYLGRPTTPRLRTKLLENDFCERGLNHLNRVEDNCR